MIYFLAKKLKSICISAIYCAIFLSVLVVLAPHFAGRWISPCFAKVYVNEFLSNPKDGDDWIELYNSDSSKMQIGNWYIEDTTSIVTTFPPDKEIGPKGFYYFEVGIRLNKPGDCVSLKDDKGNLKDTKTYESDPGEGVSWGRSPDGGSWTTFSTPTPGSSNSGSPQSSPSPSPSPSSKAEESPPPSPVSPTAYYKINDPKDQDGIILNQVKVYVDDVYIRCWAPEDLEFCSGCICGKEENITPCEFGKHKITLSKNGYVDWNDEPEINENNSPTVNPVMTWIGESGSDDSNSDNDNSDEDESLLNSPNSPAPQSSPIEEDEEGEDDEEEEIKLPEIKSNVLGEKASHEKREEESDEEQGEKKKFVFSPPVIISSVGVLCLLAAAYPFIGPLFSSFLRRVKRIRRRKL